MTPEFLIAWYLISICLIGVPLSYAMAIANLITEPVDIILAALVYPLVLMMLVGTLLYVSCQSILERLLR